MNSIFRPNALFLPARVNAGSRRLWAIQGSPRPGRTDIDKVPARDRAGGHITARGSLSCQTIK